MTTTISQLKINPSTILSQAVDYPVAVKNRSKIQAYVIGKSLYEKLIAFVEDCVDRTAVQTTNFAKGKDFEKVAKTLGV